MNNILRRYSLRCTSFYFLYVSHNPSTFSSSRSNTGSARGTRRTPPAPPPRRSGNEVRSHGAHHSPRGITLSSQLCTFSWPLPIHKIVQPLVTSLSDELLAICVIIGQSKQITYSTNNNIPSGMPFGSRNRIGPRYPVENI